MRFSRAGVLRSLGAGIAALAATGLCTIPANAATLSLNVICDSGQSHFVCDATVANGIGPVSYTWTTGNPTTHLTTTTGTLGRGSCQASRAFGGTVSVTDSIGDTGSSPFDGVCNPGQWP